MTQKTHLQPIDWINYLQTQQNQVITVLTIIGAFFFAALTVFSFDPPNLEWPLNLGFLIFLTVAAIIVVKFFRWSLISLFKSIKLNQELIDKILEQETIDEDRWIYDEYQNLKGKKGDT